MKEEGRNREDRRKVHKIRVFELDRTPGIFK